MTNEAMSCGAISRASRSTALIAPTEPRPWAPWTPERIERLKALFAEGLSREQIANHLGNISRNAVIGKLARLGFSDKKHKRVDESRRRKRHSINAGNSQRLHKIAFTPAFRQGPPKDPAPQPLPAAGDVARISLMDLEPHHCRWPSGDPVEGFCGCTKQPGSSYCKAHFERSTSNNIKPHTWAHTIGVTAHKNAEEFLAPEAVA